MNSTSTTFATQNQPRLRGFALVSVITALMLTLLLEALDQTIVGTAMPRVIAQLHGLDRYSWVVTAYILASMTMIPIVGKLSDQFGRKWFLLCGTLLFLLGSILAGASQSMNQLILFRGLQGLGAGIGMSLMNVVALRMVARRQEDLSRGLAIERGKLNGNVIGIVRTIETLKAGGLEHAAFARWAGFHAKVLNAEHELGFYSIFLKICPALLTALSIAAVLGIVGLRVIDGALTLGSLVAFQSLMASFDRPITGLVQLATNFQRIKGDLLRLEDVFNYPVEKTQRSKTRPSGMPARLTGRIDLENVRFGYSPLDPPFIDGLSLSLQPGMRVALVGVTGSGKSTVGRLICGLSKPWAGEIRFDGWRLSEVPPDVFASSVGYVDQDIFLFEGTMRENLTLWDPTVPEADIARALTDAMIHDDIVARPGNYDCQVAEGGVNFSGGQQERIEIARALVGNRSVLILDEAMSSLDTESERRIQAALAQLVRNRTTLVIAHRLSTIEQADRIIVMSEGAIVESGTHRELLTRDGHYAQLHRLQFNV